MINWLNFMLRLNKQNDGKTNHVGYTPYNFQKVE